MATHITYNVKREKCMPSNYMKLTWKKEIISGTNAKSYQKQIMEKLIVVIV